jgi:hypothetical protein
MAGMDMGVTYGKASVGAVDEEAFVALDATSVGVFVDAILLAWTSLVRLGTH